MTMSDAPSDPAPTKLVICVRHDDGGEDRYLCDILPSADGDSFQITSITPLPDKTLPKEPVANVR